MAANQDPQSLGAADGVRETQSKRHPAAAQHAACGDFRFRKMIVTETQHISRFARASHLDVAALQH